MKKRMSSEVRRPRPLQRQFAFACRRRRGADSPSPATDSESARCSTPCSPTAASFSVPRPKRCSHPARSSARPDLAGIDEVFTLWGRARRAPFRGVEQLPPGGLRLGARTDLDERRWWRPSYGRRWGRRGPRATPCATASAAAPRGRPGRHLPVRGPRLEPDQRARPDENRRRLRTFSIAFKDPRSTSGPSRRRSPRALGTQHHVVEAGPGEIARALPRVLRHTETPLVRTAPVRSILLAEQVRANDLKVVITGEGADELFWGYDLFKEVVLRELQPRRAGAGGGAARGALSLSRCRRRAARPACTRFLLETGSPTIRSART